jgi:hypothetical protein
MSAANQRRQVSYVVESVFGTTPGTPQMNLIDFTGYQATLNAEQLNSNNITAHRQISFSRRGNTGVEGTLTVEMCPDNYDWALENLFRNTYSTNVLKPGNTLTSYTIEEGFNDIAQYQIVTGARINSMSITVSPDSLVIAEFGFMGAGASALSGTPLDATPTAVTAKNSFFHEGGTFTEGGSTIATLSNISLEITNNMAGNYGLGSTSYRSFSDGKFAVTGEVTAYFESAALYNKFRNSTATSLEFTLVAGAESLKFEMSNLVYTGGNFDTGAEGPVTTTLQFTALYDGTDAASIVITRT